MEARPAYIGTRSDFFTHVHDLPPQLGGGLSTSKYLSLEHLFICFCSDIKGII